MSSSVSSRSTLTKNGNLAFDEAVIVKLAHKYRQYCSQTFLGCNSWVLGTCLTTCYSPILIRNDNDDELRMRSVGISVANIFVEMFDVELGQCIRKIEMPSNINSLSISNPPQQFKLSPLVAIGLHNRHVFILELMTGEMLFPNIAKFRHPSPINCVHILESAMNSLLFVGCENQIHIWNMATNAVQAIIFHCLDSRHQVTCLATCNTVANAIQTFHSNNDVKIVNVIVSGGTDGHVCVHDLQSFTFLCRLCCSAVGNVRALQTVLPDLTGFSRSSSSSACCECWIAAAGEGGVVKLWDALQLPRPSSNTFEAVNTENDMEDLPWQELFQKPSSKVEMIHKVSTLPAVDSALQQDTTALEQSLRLLCRQHDSNDTCPVEEEEEEERFINLMTSSPLSLLSSITCMAAVPSRSPGLAVAGGDGSVCIWHCASAALLYIIRAAHCRPITSISVTLVPRLILCTGGQDNCTKVWDISECPMEDHATYTRAARILGLRLKSSKLPHLRSSKCPMFNRKVHRRPNIFASAEYDGDITRLPACIISSAVSHPS